MTYALLSYLMNQKSIVYHLSSPSSLDLLSEVLTPNLYMANPECQEYLAHAWAAYQAERDIKESCQNVHFARVQVVESIQN